MRALIITAPREAEVQDIPAPVAEPGEVVVDVARAGICGTDIELFTGAMEYLHDGNAAYPLRIGHEWIGTVASVGPGVDREWVGRRVTGDTMLGCGRCRRCVTGYHHVCEFRTEIGVRGGRPGALAEQIAVPVGGLHPVPDSVDDTAGAFVEPGGNALRAVRAAALADGDRILILGPGTIGLLAAEFARAAGAEVHLLARSKRSIDFARSLGFEEVWSEDQLPELRWDAVIDASSSPALPAKALELVEPGKRVVYVGLAGSASLIDTRSLALKDVTAVGILGGSAGLSGAIDAYASGEVDPRPLLASIISLEDLPEVLNGRRPDGAGPGPKIQVSITTEHPQEGEAA